MNYRLRILEELSLTHHVHARASKHPASELYGSSREHGGLASLGRIKGMLQTNRCVIIVMYAYQPSRGWSEELATCLDDRDCYSPNSCRVPVYHNLSTAITLV